MARYTVEIVPKAEKEYLKLPHTDRNRIRNKMLSLEDNPRPFGAKKLKDTGYYRLRSGDFRVLYAIDDNSKNRKGPINRQPERGLPIGMRAALPQPP